MCTSVSLSLPLSASLCLSLPLSVSFTQVVAGVGSSIGVRGKLHMAQALAGSTEEYRGVQRSTEEHRGAGSTEEYTGADRASQVEELQIDLAYTAVTLRTSSVQH